MLVWVVVAAALPLLVAVLGVSGVPFLFTASLQAGGMAAYLVLLAVRYRKLAADPAVWAVLVRGVARVRSGRLWFLLGVVSGLDYALFVWATRFVDIAVVTVLFETWPLLVVGLLEMLYRGAGRYHVVTPGVVGLLLLGLAGVGLVVASQEGGLGEGGGAGLALVGAGVGLGVLASLSTSLSACLFRLSSDLARALLDGGGVRVQGHGLVSVEMLCVSVCLLATGAASVMLNVLLGVLLGEGWWSSRLLLGAAGGVLVYGLGSMAWRVANLVSGNLGVNGLALGAPVLSLLLLWVSGHVGVTRGEWFVAGAMLVVVSNGLLHRGASGSSPGFPHRSAQPPPPQGC